jgi:ribonuclease Z
VSATLLETVNNGTFLLDTGEGTYGQMFRQFGGYRRSADQLNSVDERIKNLKGIFISHLHADHHLGIVTIIDRWNKVKKCNNSNHSLGFDLGVGK